MPVQQSGWSLAVAKSCVMGNGNYCRWLWSPEEASGELNDPENSCLLLSFFDTQGQPVILLSLVLSVHSYLQCIQKKRSWQTSVWTKWSFLCHCLYTFFLCVNVCIQKMNVFKNDNWPEDYSLCLYLSMSASLLTECCESEKGLRFGEMASASWILMISLKDFLYKILYC